MITEFLQFMIHFVCLSIYVVLCIATSGCYYTCFYFSILSLSLNFCKKNEGKNFIEKSKQGARN